MDLINSEALDKLEFIKQSLDKNYSNKSSLGLMTGLSGIALFYFYHWKYSSKETSYDTGMSLLYSCMEQINNGFPYSSYSTGIAGYGWVLDHLVSEKIIDSDNDSILFQTDEFLYAEMLKALKVGNYDFLHGALGYGYYFLKRLKTTQTDSSKIKYKNYLSGLIESLDKLSHKSQNSSQYSWLSIANLKTQKKVYNLSLSHGMASIINFLSRLILIKEFSSKVEPLLNGAINYLLNSKNQEKLLSVFPSFIEPEKPKKRDSSRLAWCYGDLGIGSSLLKASKSTNNESLKIKAIDILKHSTKRRGLKENQVFDAGVCHGAFGIANVYNQVYKETKIKDFNDACDFWIKKGLNMDFHENGLAGYKKLNGSMTEWKNETSLLEGIAGIGLVLMNYLDKDIKWNECILLS
ncbi:MAG: lanthionine synthetase C family protein [bacterium]|nr:lanthionine synthetase C family protein [bacterium]